MPNKINCSYTKYFIAAIISGASLTLGFAPFSLWIFSYLSLISLIFLLNSLAKQQDLAADLYKKTYNYGYLGFFWGLGFFGTSVSWIFVSIYKYGGTSCFLAGFITLLFISFLSLFPAINLILLRQFKLINPKNKSFLLAFPSSWALMEIFRGWFLTGFPWGLLGYTQLNTGFKYYASCTGVYGVSFIVALVASLLYWILDQKSAIKILTLGTILVLCCLGLLIKNFNQDRLIDPQIVPSNHLHNIAIIQGNIAPNDKFLFQDIATLIKRIEEIYWQTTLSLIKKSPIKIDLVVWPENSLPLPVNYLESKNFLDNIDIFAKKHDFGLLLGTPIVASKGSSDDGYDYFYNSVLGLGKANGVYHKINLVPFGDYVPLERWLRGIINFFDLPMSSFTAGRDQQLGINFAGSNILATICYDIAYASNIRDRVLDLNPSVIVAISEDGWFGESLGPHQHLDIARMRAIETGKYILRATTSGISANIDNHGNVVNQTPMFEKTTLISAYQDCFKPTIWNRIGNKPIIVFLISCFIIAVILRRSE